MAIDATFWVAVSFIIFFGGLVYLKVPHKINDILNKLIIDMKNETGKNYVSLDRIEYTAYPDEQELIL